MEKSNTNHHEKNDLEAAIVSLLQDSPTQKTWKRKEIVRHLQTQRFEKKEIKKALKELEKCHKLVGVEGQKKMYALGRNGEDSKGSKKNGRSTLPVPLQIEKDNNNNNSNPLPIAELLRQRRAKNGATNVEDSTNDKTYDAHSKSQHAAPDGDDNDNDSHVEDIDEEIRRLEAELAADDDDDDDSSTGSGASDKDDGMVEQRQQDDNTPKDAAKVLCLSTLAQDRIQPLPQSCLPTNKKRTLKGIDSAVGTTESSDGKEKKRKRRGDNVGPPVISEGLKAAVQQVLQGYTPRSQEKIPFYCRVCAQQYANEVEFSAHKSTEFHQAAVTMERKASFCKLCRKQLTSPAQLQEHLSSKPHKQRLDFVRSKQQPSSKVRPRNPPPQLSRQQQPSGGKGS